MASARTFEQHGDLNKTVSAKIAEAQLLVSRSLYAEAERLLLDVEPQVAAASTTRILTRGYWQTSANAAGGLGRVDRAIHYYDCASALLEDIGARTETVRIRWNVAVDARLKPEKSRMPVSDCVF